MDGRRFDVDVSDPFLEIFFKEIVKLMNKSNKWITSQYLPESLGSLVKSQ
jgi:hypothetical protein